MISITNENNKTEDVLVFCAEVLWEELLNKKLLEFSKDKMKSFMSMSHELRTPLNCIMIKNYEMFYSRVIRKKRK